MNTTVSASLCAALLCASLAAAEPDFSPNTLLVGLDGPVADIQQAARRLDGPGLKVERVLSARLGLVSVRLDGLDLPAARAALAARPDVRWCQLDHFTFDRRVPDDPSFPLQWSLGQASDADVDAAEAWEFATGGQDVLGRRLVVAVVDGGMDLAHPDLAAGVWSNPAEIADDGQDNDGNGYVDDVHGWNAYNNSGSLVFNAHGTHVSGIVGARGNNTNQVCGVNWDVDLMTVCGSSTLTSTAIAAYGYVLEQKSRWLETGGLQGANVVATNSSFGVNYAPCGSGEYPAWNEMYEALGAVGVLNAASTMNINANVDAQGDVPTSCPSDYLVSVTNTTSQDLRNASCAYGAHSIDLGAPGTQVLSTYINGGTANMSGTSMSAPHVAGAIALLHAAASDSLARLVQADPAQGARVVKALLLASVDPLPALAGITVTGGRLNVGRAALGAARWPELLPTPLDLVMDVHRRPHLSWQVMPGARFWHVERRALGEEAWTRLATVDEPFWIGETALPGESAEFRVVPER